MIQGGLENYFELRFHVCITLVQVMGKCFPERKISLSAQRNASL
jgi:hypothetical protein